MKKPIAPLGLLLSLCLFTDSAQAYCAATGTWDLFWQQEFPDLNVAVWVALGPQFGVQYTGRTPEEIGNIIQEIIARHNESNVGPRLYFAGFTNVDLNVNDLGKDASDPVDYGIYVHSVECSLLDANPENPIYCGVTEVSPPLACGAVVPSLPGKARVFLRPATCPSVPGAPFGMAMFEGLEMPSVILHEIGHTLGLQHNDVPCQGANEVKGNGPDDNSGVMTRLLSIDDRVGMREWRKDDIDGLEYLYPTPDFSDQVILYWDDDGFPGPPTDDDLIRLELAEPIMRPLSVATNSAGVVQAGVSVSPQSAVIYYLWDELANEIREQGLVEPGPLGLTYSTPAVALGEESIFVVWHSGESHLGPNGRLRWALRDLAGGPWTYASSSFEIGSKRFGTGHDPATGNYLITMLTDNASLVQILEVDATGQEVIIMALDGLEGFDVGNAICAADVGGRDCVIPYTRSQIGGPYLGWISLDDDGVRDVVDTMIAPGMQVDLTRRNDAIGGFFGTTSARRYAVADPPSGISVSVAPVLSSPYAGEGWPFEPAEYVVNGSQRTRVFTRRFTECGDGQVEVGEVCDDGNELDTDDCVSPFCKLAECGDGFLWAGVEGCDDGNLDPGDGCNEVCLIEGAGDTGETGGGVDELGDNGCECQVDPQRGLAGGPLALLALLGLGRRRRRSHHC